MEESITDIELGILYEILEHKFITGRELKNKI